MERYPYYPVDVWTASSAEWTSVMRDNALNANDLVSELSESSGKTLILASCGVLVALLSASAIAFALGTVTISNSIMLMTQKLVQQVIHPTP